MGVIATASLLHYSITPFRPRYAARALSTNWPITAG
jgi:hypothetical protein